MFKTVRSKFSLVYIGLVVLIALLGFISVSTLSGISQTINGLITTNYHSIVRLAGMKEALNNMNSCVMNYLYGEDSGKQLRAFATDAVRFEELYAAERATIIIPQEQIYIDGIGKEFENYVALFQELRGYSLRDEAEREKALRMYREVVVPQQTLVENQMQALHLSNEAALFARRDEAAQSAKNSIQITSVSFLAAATGGYFLATLYTRRFFKPLYEITENIKLVREGNLNRKTAIASQDEFGMLAEEFNNMIHRLSVFEQSTLGSLINERNKADSLVKSIHEPMMILDEVGNILMMNEGFETLFHITEESSVGKPLMETAAHNGFEEYVAALKSGNVPHKKDKTIAIPVGGEDMFYHIAATPIPGLEGKIAGLIMILHDITEMKQLEKARGDYIATISHEFKTPLTSIVIGADLIAEERIGSLTQDQKEIIDTMKEDSRRLEILVGEILELSRMESSKTLYRIAPCSLLEIVEASVKQFEVPAERGGIALKVELPQELPPVRADFSKITWVLNNLLSNAVKYTKAGDTITVGAKEAPGGVEVFVFDTGIGVPPEFVEQIFEKYVQIKGYDIEIRGSGLGLAAAREILNAHGGRIWCDPHVEKGSRFVFTLEAVGKHEG